MKKKKILFLFPIVSTFLLGAVILISGGLDNIEALTRNSSEEIWHHYAAVTPTENMHGSKEFWAKGSEGCSTPYFEDPGVTCTEHDFSTYDSFEALTISDERYIPSLFEERNAVYPTLSNDGKTVTYGIYPQTNVNNSSLVSALNAFATPESNGWYLYKGNYYAKVSAIPNDPNYYFDNGTRIVSGTTYWFKCEPITWNVLSNDNGEYYVLSKVLLDAHRYYHFTSNGTIEGQTIYLNNYKYSNIRTWLNDDFYNSAFALNSGHILTTTVDNSAETTNNLNNPYACENTQDKVFLPSYQDYINNSYGFSTSADSTDTRCCRTTDWARARGAWYAWYSADSSYYYNGSYWTRSPYSGDSRSMKCVYANGDLGGYSGVVGGEHTVRPAITITKVFSFPTIITNDFLK